MKRFFVLTPADPAYPRVRKNFLDTLGAELAQGPREVIIQEPKRTSEQNKRLHAMLGDVSDQVGFRRARWRGERLVEDGAYVLLSECPDAVRLPVDVLKDIFAAALRRPRFFAGIDGGVVAVGMHTSHMTVRQMRDLIELVSAWGTEIGVVWTDPKQAMDERIAEEMAA